MLEKGHFVSKFQQEGYYKRRKILRAKCAILVLHIEKLTHNIFLLWVVYGEYTACIIVGLKCSQIVTFRPIDSDYFVNKHSRIVGTVQRDYHSLVQVIGGDISLLPWPYLGIITPRPLYSGIMTLRAFNLAWLYSGIITPRAALLGDYHPQGILPAGLIYTPVDENTRPLGLDHN